MFQFRSELSVIFIEVNYLTFFFKEKNIYSEEDILRWSHHCKSCLVSLKFQADLYSIFFKWHRVLLFG